MCTDGGGVSHRTLACGYVMCGRVCKGKGVCRRYKNERDRRFPCDVARCVKLWTDCACVFIRLSLEQKHGSRLNRSASHRPLSRPHHLHRLRVRHQTIVSVVQMARHADAILQKVAKAHPSVRIRDQVFSFEVRLASDAHVRQRFSMLSTLNQEDAGAAAEVLARPRTP